MNKKGTTTLHSLWRGVTNNQQEKMTRAISTQRSEAQGNFKGLSLPLISKLHVDIYAGSMIRQLEQRCWRCGV